MFVDADTRHTCVLFIDLDDFKIVNDSMGHAAGDELLRVVARRLRSVTRVGETVVRLGGDEFAIVLNADGPEAAVAAAQRALAVMQDPVAINGTSVDVGCSIGIALSAEGIGAGTSDELVRNADFAMYMAKSQGKNRYEIFAPTLHAEVLGRVKFKHELAQAVRLGQFILEYQPVIELDTRALQGFEALIRWQHPTLGLLAPSEFIALAEETGDILAMGEWVINEACHALAEHHRHQDTSERPLWMSVNVSPVEIASAGFLETVNDALERHGVVPSSLVIEITEGVAMTDTGAAGLILSALRSTGVHIALDDFGTGFSSLRSLHELPIDVIKIDRSFLASAESDTEAESMLEAIVTLGRSLGLDIIAEGIETSADLDRLAAFSISGQGYLFARPLSASDAAIYREQASERLIATTP
jgi:diguanylate cyclase (GGDEF)-like protein